MSVALLGLWMAMVGVADLGRTSSAHFILRRLAHLAAGTVVLGLGLVALDVDPREHWWFGLALLLSLAGWVMFRRPSLSMGCLVLGGTVATLSAGLLTSERVWPAWLQQTAFGSFSTSQALVMFGVVIAQLSTANLVVRMFLGAVGVPATTNEKQLRGGRFLGPMERLLLVSLGALGEITAASLVIAAKGLLRFPEIQRAQREPAPAEGPSDVTEYFLIGSLASWLLALGGAGLIHLAR